MEIKILLIASGVLFAAALFMGYELKKIRKLVERKENLRLNLLKVNGYNRNLNALLALHGDKGIATVITSRLKGRLVIFGYGGVGKCLIRELDKHGHKVAYVIENNELARNDAILQTTGFPFITTSQISQFRKPGDEILITLLHDAAYSVRQELSELLEQDTGIYLLEEFLRLPVNDPDFQMKTRIKGRNT